MKKLQKKWSSDTQCWDLEALEKSRLRRRSRASGVWKEEKAAVATSTVKISQLEPLSDLRTTEERTLLLGKSLNHLFPDFIEKSSFLGNPIFEAEFSREN